MLVHHGGGGRAPDVGMAAVGSGTANPTAAITCQMPTSHLIAIIDNMTTRIQESTRQCPVQLFQAFPAE